MGDPEHLKKKSLVAIGGEQALLPEYIPGDAFHSTIAHLDSIWFGETGKKSMENWNVRAAAHSKPIPAGGGLQGCTERIAPREWRPIFAAQTERRTWTEQHSR